ncbi:hypothetical protein L3X07_01420 [Levilactobacillus brevis]|nr:hypothetical protein [Levilactobacillus brevis]
MYAVIAILMIILIAGVGQLYLDNRDAFRKRASIWQPVINSMMNLIAD